MNDFDQLWEHFLADELGEAEKEAFRQLLQTNDPQIAAAIGELLAKRKISGLAPAERKDIIFQKILEKTRREQPASVRRLRTRWLWAAAAVLLILIGGWLIFRTGRTPAGSPQVVSGKAILPGRNGAILTLSNGKTILLDTVGNGALTGDRQVVVEKKDGQLAYKGSSATEMLYNTITTPKGRQWQLALGDGTKVWLNAASSIHYPVSFTGEQREVTITGEAYFEVAADAKHPFIVKTNRQTITVLGTSFDINAYEDEPDTRTSLVTGEIKVDVGDNHWTLHPGQQAISIPDTGETKITRVDTDNIIAWINGRFRFDDADIKTVMRQISRWYDVDIEYQGVIPDYKFTGGTFRSSQLSDVLHVLELSNFHFRTEDHKIIVMP